MPDDDEVAEPSDMEAASPASSLDLDGSDKPKGDAP
jgi:hypothetical protein